MADPVAINLDEAGDAAGDAALELQRLAEAAKAAHESQQSAMRAWAAKAPADAQQRMADLKLGQSPEARAARDANLAFRQADAALSAAKSRQAAAGPDPNRDVYAELARRMGMNVAPPAPSAPPAPVAPPPAPGPDPARAGLGGLAAQASRAAAAARWERDDLERQRRERANDPLLMPMVQRVEPEKIPTLKPAAEKDLSVADAARMRMGRQRREADIKAEMASLAAAAAGGPAGLALKAAEEGAKKLAGLFDGLGEAAKVAGEGVSRMARNDNLGAMLTASDAAAKSLGKIPVAGQLAEAALKATGATVRAFDEVVTAFVARGAELAKFSPELALAGARADIRSLFADLREADRLGPGIARLTDAQSRLSAEFRELLLPIKQAVVEVLIPVVEGAGVAVREAAGRVGTTEGQIDTMLSLARQALGGMGPALPLGLDYLRQLVGYARTESERLEENKDLLKPLHDALDEMNFGTSGGSFRRQVDPITSGQSARPQDFVPGRPF